MMQLRPYQQIAVSDLATAIRMVQSALLVMPTGAGKTVVFTEIARRASAAVKWCCHPCSSPRASKQASDKLTKAGVEHGIIAAGFPKNRFLGSSCLSPNTGEAHAFIGFQPRAYHRGRGTPCCCRLMGKNYRPLGQRKNNWRNSNTVKTRWPWFVNTFRHPRARAFRRAARKAWLSFSTQSIRSTSASRPKRR